MLHRPVEIAPVSDAERLAAAVGLIPRGDVAAAEAIARGVLARDAGNAEAANLLGAAAIARNDGPAAVRVLAAAASAFPGRAEIVSNLAVAHQMTGDLAAAFAAAEHACTLEPRDAPKRLMLGQLCLDLGRTAEAAGHAEALLSAAPGDADVLVFAATVALADGDTRAAEALFARAAATAPNHLEAQLNLARLLAAGGRRRAALAAAERARLAAPADGRARVGFAARLAEAGRLDEAEAEIKQVLAAGPEAVEPNELWSRIALARGAVEKAIASMADVARRRGGDTEALAALARILRAAGRYEQALAITGTLAERADAPAEVARMRRALLLSLGRLAEAWPALEAAGDEPGGLVAEPGDDLAETLIHLRYAERLAARLGGPLPIHGADVAALLPAGSALAPAVAAPLPGTTLLALSAVPRALAVPDNDAPRTAPPAPDGERRAAWAAALAEHPRPWIGITWGDGHEGPPLGAVAGPVGGEGTLVGLTGGEDRHQLAAHPAIIDGGRHLSGLADVVAAVAVLDGLVGVEGAVLAVAGALGTPAVALLPAGHGWAWRPDAGGRAAFFPTVAVCRQDRPGSWRPVLEQLPAAFAAAVAGGRP
jgi:Flp pilus assembly protein TadD